MGKGGPGSPGFQIRRQNLIIMVNLGQNGSESKRLERVGRTAKVGSDLGQEG